MSTLVPLLALWNISGAMYGKVPGPLPVDVTVASVAFLMRVDIPPMSQHHLFQVLCSLILNEIIQRTLTHLRTELLYINTYSIFCGFKSWCRTIGL